MILELGIFLIALLAVLLRVWQGWRHGATREIRWLLACLFGMLVALRYWYQATEAVSRWVHRDPRLLAAAVFAVLFVVAAELAFFAIRRRAEHVQSVEPNPLNTLLGAILGLFSGAVIGSSLLLVFSLELPALTSGFDRRNFPLPLEQLPLGAFRAIEKNIAGIPPQSPSHTPLPELPAGGEPASKPPGFVWD